MRRRYAYARGMLKLFRDELEMVVTSAGQVTDLPGEQQSAGQRVLYWIGARPRPW